MHPKTCCVMKVEELLDLVLDVLELLDFRTTRQ